MRTLVLLTLVGLMGCATAVPSGVSVAQRNDLSVRFDESIWEFAGYALQGADAWSSLGAALVIDEGASRVVRCATWDMGSAAATANAAGIAVHCLYLYGLFDVERVHLFQHEFGHLFGVGHVGGDDSVMSETVNDVTVFSALDLAAFAAR